MINFCKNLFFGLLLISNFFYAASVLANSPADYTAGLFNVVRAQQQGDFGGQQFGQGGFSQGGGMMGMPSGMSPEMMNGMMRGGGMMPQGMMGGMGPMMRGGGDDGGRWSKNAVQFGPIPLEEAIGIALKKGVTVSCSNVSDLSSCADEVSSNFEQTVSDAKFLPPSVKQVSSKPWSDYYNIAKESSGMTTKGFVAAVKMSIPQIARDLAYQIVQDATDKAGEADSVDGAKQAIEEARTALQQAGFPKSILKEVNKYLNMEVKRIESEGAMQEQMTQAEDQRMQMMKQGQEFAKQNMEKQRERTKKMMEQQQGQQGEGGDNMRGGDDQMMGGGMPGMGGPMGGGMMGGMGGMMRGMMGSGMRGGYGGGPPSGMYGPPVGDFGPPHGDNHRNGGGDNMGGGGRFGSSGGSDQGQTGGGQGGPHGPAYCKDHVEECFREQKNYRAPSPESSPASTPAPVPPVAPAPSPLPVSASAPSAMNSSYIDYVAQVSKKASKKSPVVKKKSLKKLMSPTFY